MDPSAFQRYVVIAHSWVEIVASYNHMARSNPDFINLADVARRIADSSYVAAGLCRIMSMHDMILGPSARVLDNPHLHISYDFCERSFVFTYQDGSPKPWGRGAEPSESYAALERFLTKRSRWFRFSPR